MHNSAVKLGCILLAVTMGTMAARSSSAGAVPAAQGPSWGWTKAKWTGSDAPYRAVRTEIESELARGTAVQSVAERYRARHLKAPHDKVLAFGWCYATYMTLGRVILAGNELPDAADAAMATRPPYAREQIRLSFMMATMRQRSPELLALGRRLLAENPRDWDVRLAYFRLLPGHTRKECLAKIAEADAEIRYWPDDGGPYLTKAYAYHALFMASGNDVAALDQAIYWMQEELKHRVTPEERILRLDSIARLRKLRSELSAGKTH